MKRYANALITIGMLILLLAVVVAFSGCHKDDDDRSTGMSPAPSPIPTVECCDFKQRCECVDVRVTLLAKPGYIAKHNVCFDRHDNCLLNCPAGER